MSKTLGSIFLLTVLMVFGAAATAQETKVPAEKADKKEVAKKDAQSESKTESKDTKPATAEINTDMLKQDLPFDIIYGEANAPVTIVEYASLSCSHCAKFHTNVLPEIKKQFIETGKAKLVFRHFPLNAPALKASMMVDCAEDAPQKKAMLEALFATQETWAYSKDFETKIKEVAKANAIDEAKATSCISNKETEDKLLILQFKAHKEMAIDTTPTVFVNAVKLEKTDLKSVSDAIKSAKP